jgi:cupin 2 domain-containing protein
MSGSDKAPVAGGNLFACRPAAAGGEVFETLFANPNCRVERILSFGQASPPGFWYEQAEDEWVMLLTGTATLAFEGGQRLGLRAGDWISLLARCRHRVDVVSDDAVWLAVHCRAETA